MAQEQKIPHLDYYVEQTLKNLASWEYPKLDIQKSDTNLFLGAGSAFCVAELFAQKFGGLALNASNYAMFMQNRVALDFNSVNIISASGGKDSLPMAEFCQSLGLGSKLNLITCNANAPSKDKCGAIFVFPSLNDPPTYNTSTYGSMIYWLFQENPAIIWEEIQNIQIPNLRQYHYIFFLAKDQYAPITEMAARKVAETLQGVAVNSSGFTHGTHGMLRQPDDKRLLFMLNQEYPFPENKFSLNFEGNLALMMACYYIIGKNQTDQDTQNILENYSQTVQKLGWQINQVN